jgi:hypothetical protein
LENVTFDDGGTASGSFIFDAATQTYTPGSIHITTTLGTAFGGATYTGLSTIFGSSEGGIVLMANGDLLLLNFVDNLTNGGGSVFLSGDGEGICDVTGCNELRVVNVGVPGVPDPELFGTPVSTSTPEPSALLLLGMGLVPLLAGAAIRKVSLV